MASGEDAFAAFMGEVNELSEKAEREAAAQEPKPPPQNARPTAPPSIGPSVPESARSRPTVSAKPKVLSKQERQEAEAEAEAEALAQAMADTSGVARELEAVHQMRMQASRSFVPRQTSTSFPPHSGHANSGSSAYQTDRAQPSRKAFVREIGGEKWVDQTLGEWPENDFRLFVGNLGNEVGDDLLTQTFSRYPSFNKAKVVREKRTQKSRGFGFVSFADGVDFARAIREMDGKYLGNRPCKLKKSDWKQRGIRETKGSTQMGPHKKIRKSKKHLNF